MGTVKPPTTVYVRIRRWAGTRRGVVSVVSMMFMILFGSLAAAMAIMSKGNIVTASTHLHVIRAQGAAETGLRIAQDRLREATGRFAVGRSVIDAGFGTWLWSSAQSGTNPTYGDVTILPATSYASTGNPTGIIGALADIHAHDSNTVVASSTSNINVPTIANAPTGTDATIYKTSAWLYTPAVALNAQPPKKNGQPAPNPTGTAFQITYMPLADGTGVRVAVEGFDYDYTPRGDPIKRRIVQDYAFAKRVNSAILSPNKIMIGKNVLVEGDLGATYTDVSKQYGDPLIIKSDFYGMDPGLDVELKKLFNAIAQYDVDKDNRLRVGHPVEGPGIPDFSNLPGFTHTEADGTTVRGPDITGDGYVDEFDVFIMYYDGRNGGKKDGKVALSAAISAGTPNAGLTPEFVTSSGAVIDDQLAMLIDASNPDRNKNGQWAYIDNNNNGHFDAGVDELLDQEVVTPAAVSADLKNYIHTNSKGQSVLFRDQVLGFRDGVIDKRDSYAKVRGKLVFRVNSTDWATSQPNYMQRLQGPIKPPAGASATNFNVGSGALPDVVPASFTTDKTALQTIADGDSFNTQVAKNLGIATSQLATWTAANNSTDPTAAKLTPLSGDSDGDGMPDNAGVAYFEKMPFNNPSYTDWYYRPVYENMTFKNVQIPMGNNGLFKNCTFIGVTYVRTSTANTHTNWTLYGKMKLSSAGRPTSDPSRTQYTGTSYPAMLSSTDRPVWMASIPLDKADIPDNQKAITIGYNTLPDPLLINGKRCINTKDFSNNLRFHDCLIVGSVVSDAPTNYTNTRNKLQFTGATRFTTVNPNAPTNPTLNPDPEDMPEIMRSSIMLPQYSVDIGQFNSPPTQDVQLRGAIIAGVLDVRGNADIQGSLILTFKPVLGQAPLVDALGNPVGNPANFNASIGYFGASDGDAESIDPATLPIVNGQKIVGWDLDGDGLPDLGPDQTPTPAQIAAGAKAVPFWGYGGITLRFDPTMSMPDGLILPLQVDTVHTTYKETAK
jgi:hypothetical protein